MTFGLIRSEAFEGQALHLIEYGPNRVPCVLLFEQARALGYEDPKELARLFADIASRGEADEGDDYFRLDYAKVKDLRAGFAVGLKGVANPISPMTREVILLSRSGAALACMRSDAPRAVAFRKWAKRVLVEVMETGRYEEPQLATASATREMLASQAREITLLREVAEARRERADALQQLADSRGEMIELLREHRLEERAPEEKRRAVREALASPDLCVLSSRRLGGRLGVSHRLVQLVRDEHGVQRGSVLPKERNPMPSSKPAAATPVQMAPAAASTALEGPAAAVESDAALRDGLRKMGGFKKAEIEAAVRAVPDGPLAQRLAAALRYIRPNPT